MTVDRFKKMFLYNYWANKRVWKHVTMLSEEQFTRRCDYSMGSVSQQVVHQMFAEELWLSRIRGDEQTVKARRYASRVAIASHWKDVEQAWLSYLDTLAEDQLNEEITFTSQTYETEFHNPRWEGLMQTINHSTDHRAQILSLIHQVGGDTSEQDFIFYTWGK